MFCLTFLTFEKRWRLLSSPTVSYAEEISKAKTSDVMADVRPVRHTRRLRGGFLTTRRCRSPRLTGHLTLLSPCLRCHGNSAMTGPG